MRRSGRVARAADGKPELSRNEPGARIGYHAQGEPEMAERTTVLVCVRDRSRKGKKQRRRFFFAKTEFFSHNRTAQAAKSPAAAARAAGVKAICAFCNDLKLLVDSGTIQCHHVNTNENGTAYFYVSADVKRVSNIAAS